MARMQRLCLLPSHSYRRTAAWLSIANRSRPGNNVDNIVDMAVKTISISMDERTYRQAKAAAERAGVPMSAWMSRSAKEKVQRDAAATVAEIDRGTGHAWAAWAEASEQDFGTPEAGKGAA
jgi:hypothetical protein